VSVIAPPALRIIRCRDDYRPKPISLAPRVIDTAGALPRGWTATGMFHLNDAQAGILDFCTWRRALPRAAVLAPARRPITAQLGRRRLSVRGWVTRVQTHRRVAPATWRRSHATGSASTRGLRLRRSAGVSRLASLTAGGLSEEGR
jgi:hypothetical protein